jgi:phosphoribosylaminoimidazole-succinocarboxamide synthase
MIYEVLTNQLFNFHFWKSDINEAIQFYFRTMNNQCSLTNDDPSGSQGKKKSESSYPLPTPLTKQQLEQCQQRESELMNRVFPEIHNRTLRYMDSYIQESLGKVLTTTDLNTSKLPEFESKSEGKTRDQYICKKKVIFIETDRHYGFKRQLQSIPFKGESLSSLSLWWFDHTKHLVPNHIISSPHPNVMVTKRCTVFPISFMMRGYITGNFWNEYCKNDGNLYCGFHFPKGLSKNQKLSENKLTPAVKQGNSSSNTAEDILLSEKGIVEKGIMTQSEFTTCSGYAHRLFSFGQEEALNHGLLLVDTRYEFGKDENGTILLVDVLHTPDSSRYWVADTYEQRLASNEVRKLVVLDLTLTNIVRFRILIILTKNY